MYDVSSFCTRVFRKRLYFTRIAQDIFVCSLDAFVFGDIVVKNVKLTQFVSVRQTRYPLVVVYSAYKYGKMPD